MKDEGRWHVGNAFGSRGHAEHACDTIQEVLYILYYVHASPHLASL